MKKAALLVLILALFVACPKNPPIHVPGPVIIVPPPPPPVVVPQADQSEPRTGVDVYQLIAFPLDQINAYLDALVENGGSVLRVFLVYTWPEGFINAGWKFSPYKQVGWYNETYGAFAGRAFPVFDLTVWDDEIWAKWRAVFAMCAERKIRLTVSVFDGCSTGTLADRYNPLIMNCQHIGMTEMPTYTGFDGTPVKGNGEHTGGYFGGFQEDADGMMKGYIKVLLVKVALELKASGVDFRIGTNEVQCPLIPAHDQAYSDAVLHDWLEMWIKTLEGEGVAPAQIVLSIAGTHDRARVTVPLVGQYGVVEQMHGPNSDVTLTKFLNAYPGVEQDGDGFDSAGAGYENEYGYRMPSLAQCAAIRAILKARGNKQFSIFNSYIEGEGWQDITQAKWTEQRALAGK